MYCPSRFTVDTKVIDSRPVGGGSSVCCRRQCLACDERFIIFEMAELMMPWAVKSNGVRESSSKDELRSGVLRALERRPVNTGGVEMAVNHIKTHPYGTGERGVVSEMIGNLAMEQLKRLDRVAYIRSASIYHSFEDIKESGEEIARLQG